MGDVVPFDKDSLPASLAAAFGAGNSDLTDNVSAGFAVVSFRGSKWRVKHGGEETVIRNPDGDPVAALEVVIVAANKHVSKNYYEGKYHEGDKEAPDCFSLDGIQPDASVTNPVSKNCAGCPKNVFGSRITDTGKKAKACSDNRRIAVVPSGDIANERFGGPMLLRVPATSLTDLASFGSALDERGIPFQSVVTKVGLDEDASYPKPTFKPVRMLTNEEGLAVVQAAKHPRIKDILSSAAEMASSDADSPPAHEEKQKASAKRPSPEAPAKAETDSDELGARLDDILGDLDLDSTGG